MAWKLKNGSEQLCNINDTPGEVKIRSEKYKGLEVQLKQNEPYTAERQLGVRLSMDGSDRAEFQYRLEQSKLFAGKITSPPFNRLDTETIYRAMDLFCWLLPSNNLVYG